MQWEFNLPVKIVFGSGKRNEIGKYIDEIGGTLQVLQSKASPMNLLKTPAAE